MIYFVVEEHKMYFEEVADDVKGFKKISIKKDTNT